MPNRIKGFQKNHDVIFFYSKTDDYHFNVLEGEMTEGSRKTYESGKRRGYNANNSKKMVTVFDWDKYTQAINDGKIPADLRPVEFKGGNPAEKDWWDIKILGGPGNKERTGYPTQKPIALLERIIKASSKENDVVFDPFCGCATTMVAADRLQRQWVGIDISSKAIELVYERIRQDQGGIGNQRGMFENIIARKDIPQRTDIEVLRLYNSLDNKKHLYGQQAGNCNGCQTHFEVQHLEVDHIIAKSQGGTDHIENLQLLCGHCNKVKGNRGQEYLIAKLEGKQVDYA